jgi:hypothetical protein
MVQKAVEGVYRGMSAPQSPSEANPLRLTVVSPANNLDSPSLGGVAVAIGAEEMDGIDGTIAGEAVPPGFLDGSPHILESGHHLTFARPARHFSLPAAMWSLEQQRRTVTLLA